MAYGFLQGKAQNYLLTTRRKVKIKTQAWQNPSNPQKNGRILYTVKNTMLDWNVKTNCCERRFRSWKRRLKAKFEVGATLSGDERGDPHRHGLTAPPDGTMFMETDNIWRDKI